MRISADVPTPAPAPLRTQLLALATQFFESGSGVALGARTLRMSDLSGDDWNARFNEATRQSSTDWKAAYAALPTIKTAAALLGDDPLAISAREAIAGALGVANRAFDGMGRAYMAFGRAPVQETAVRTLAMVAYISDQGVDTFDRTALALRELALRP